MPFPRYLICHRSSVTRFSRSFSSLCSVASTDYIASGRLAFERRSPSSIENADALARRLAHYHLLVAEQLPDDLLRQVVIFAPSINKGERVPTGINLRLTDSFGHGLTFSAPVKDLRKVPADVFERSGEIDDLLLGLLGPGADLPDYVEKVFSRVGQLTGEVRAGTLEKLVAIWLMNDNLPNKGYREVFDMSWIDEVKDRPAAQRFVEIAGKERIARERAEATRRALAGVLVDHASKAGLESALGARRTDREAGSLCR